MNKERISELLIKIPGYSIVGIILTFPIILIVYSIPLLRESSLLQTLLTTPWKPETGQYGLISFIGATLIMGVISTGLSFFIGLSIALFLFKNRLNRSSILTRKLIQSMGGIPTVAYGLGGLIILVPAIRSFTSSPTGLSLLTTSLVLALLILPTVVLYIDDGFQAVDSSFLMAPRALGASEEQIILFILLPQTAKNLVTASILGFSRAISDTMLGLMLSGCAFRFPESVLKSGRNLTSHIALIIPGEFDSIEFKAVFFSALILIVLVTGFNRIVHNLETRND